MKKKKLTRVMWDEDDYLRILFDYDLWSFWITPESDRESFLRTNIFFEYIEDISSLLLLRRKFLRNDSQVLRILFILSKI